MATISLDHLDMVMRIINRGGVAVTLACPGLPSCLCHLSWRDFRD